MGLSSVFNDFQIVSPSDSQNGIHISRQSMNVHRHNGFCLLGNFLLNLRRINGECIRFNIYKHRDPVVVEHGTC